MANHGWIVAFLLGWPTWQYFSAARTGWTLGSCCRPNKSLCQKTRTHLHPLLLPSCHCCVAWLRMITQGQFLPISRTELVESSPVVLPSVIVDSELRSPPSSFFAASWEWKLVVWAWYGRKFFAFLGNWLFVFVVDAAVGYIVVIVMMNVTAVGIIFLAAISFFTLSIIFPRVGYSGCRVIVALCPPRIKVSKRLLDRDRRTRRMAAQHRQGQSTHFLRCFGLGMGKGLWI